MLDTFVFRKWLKISPPCYLAKAMGVDLEQSLLTFETVFGQVFAEVAAHKLKNEIIVLAISRENLEKVDMRVIENYKDQIYGMCDMTRCAVLTTSACAELFLKADKNHSYKLSKFKGIGAQRAWAGFEGSKLHEILSVTNRYMLRPVTHKNKKIDALKALWWKHKPEMMRAQECK